jgi:threonine/homoserine/homoserine lactone efflux protein
MALHILLAFALGLVASFVGTLPFGTVNLTVAETTLRKDLKVGIKMAIAGGIVELLHSFLAVHCSSLIADYLEESLWVKWFVILIFLGLGLYFYFKKLDPGRPPKKRKFRMTDVGKAAFLSLINPQALPFWVFVVSWFTAENILSVSSMNPDGMLVGFLLGISAGKFLALFLFAALSTLIRRRADLVGKWANKVIGSIFIFLSIFQAFRFWW